MSITKLWLTSISTSAATFHDTTVSKEIKYDRTTRDYACYVDGRYVGSRTNYSDGETLCNEVAYDLISSGERYTATQLDGGSDPDTMAADNAALLTTTTTVTSDTWQNEDGSTYTDYTVGAGLTKVLVGSYSGDKAGIELVIGGACINQRLEQVLTLADVRQLRDNLNVLLADTRLEESRVLARAA